MKEVIKRYKKGIFVYVLINVFALFVNYFSIDNSYHNYSQHGIEQTDTRVYFFTPGYKATFGFWPMVSFMSDKNKRDTHEYSQSFNGIFHSYDTSEFLFYIGLLFVFILYKTYIQTPKIKNPEVAPGS